MSQPSKILWSVSIRAICKQGLVQSRARGVLVPTTETSSREIRASACPQSVAVLPTSGSVIRAFASRWCGRLAGKLERGGPVGARFPAIFSSHKGPLRLICNFLGAFKALRSLSSNAGVVVKHG